MSDTTRDTALQNIGQALSRIAANEVAVLNIQSYASASWTPTLTFGGSAAGMTLASVGQYVQLGNYFVFWFSADLSAKGSSTGNAAIGGLPVTSNSGGANSGAGGTLTAYGNMASISSLPFINVGPSSTLASLSQAGTASSLALTAGNFTSISSLSGWFSFYI